MNACAMHREFLGALADGEKELVPAATIEHVENCADCSREAAAHRLLNSRLREASAHLDEAVMRPLPATTRRLHLVLKHFHERAVAAQKNGRDCRLPVAAIDGKIIEIVRVHCPQSDECLASAGNSGHEDEVARVSERGLVNDARDLLDRGVRCRARAMNRAQVASLE